MVAHTNGGFGIIYQERSFGISSTLWMQRFDNSGTALWSNAVQLTPLVTAATRYYSVLSDGDITYAGIFANPSGQNRFDAVVQRINADVLLINKADLVSEGELRELTAILAALNPEARCVSIRHGHIDLRVILNTGAFDFERASQAAGWMKTLRGHERSEADEYGITNIVYRARRPFHPERLWRCFQEPWPGVLRSKGLFWIATRPDLIGLWSQAGGTGNVRWAGRWYAAMPKEEWPEEEEEYQRLQGVWDPEYGDRSQELVLIGRRMDHAALTAWLDACLVTEAEWASGRSSWEGKPDPFPPMDIPAEADALSATQEER